MSVAKFFATLSNDRILPDELLCKPNYLVNLLQFILMQGVTDSNADVRNLMSSAGISLISNYGKENKVILLSYLEEVLAKKPESNENLTKFDYRYAAIVVLLGVVARHLEKNDPMVSKILELQIEALKTPSKSVQRTVSDCLSPLAQSLKGSELAEKTLDRLMETMMNAEKYGERRGAAFGLCAMVKELGIPCLKQHNIMGRLKEACQNGSITSRQGSLFAFECMSEKLGLLFEPYIIGIVDVLLASFSNSSDQIRIVAQGATKVIMNKLSAHGVKQMLAPIISTLTSNSAWKSRQEAIKMLGMMANCAPKQLAASLPQIVPSLVQASADPHPKVEESAKYAMTEISAVIRNPEIANLSPVLLAALGDPSNRTKDALEALLECEFMHSIDPPSLALVIPILGRALKDRGADLKRKASAITGNMISMVSEPKALSPYLSTVVPGLKDCLLLDPIPDVRASGAKALGTLYNGIGESEPNLQDLFSWLLKTLKSHDSPVERSGAEQPKVWLKFAVAQMILKRKMLLSSGF